MSNGRVTSPATLRTADVIPYLLGADLLRADDVVNDDIVVDDVSRRNRNHTVRSAGGIGLFLKQADVRQSTKTVGREAYLYKYLEDHMADFALVHAAGFRLHDPTRDLLVLDCLNDVAPVGDVQSSEPGLQSADQLGSVVAQLHCGPVPRPGVFEAPPPWVLSVLRLQRSILEDFSAAALAVFTIVQESGDMAEAIKALAEAPGSRTLIHGDLRLDNCLLSARDLDGPQSLFLVDWELAGVGDPCWDVGAVFSDYLMFWIRSLPVFDSMPLTDSFEHATYPFVKAQVNVCAFWRAYRSARPDVMDWSTVLDRSIECTGARLIQAAVEMAQASAELTKTIVCTLQLAENLLTRPTHARSQIFAMADT